MFVHCVDAGKKHLIHLDGTEFLSMPMEIDKIQMYETFRNSKTAENATGYLFVSLTTFQKMSNDEVSTSTGAGTMLLKLSVYTK